ncbi:2296_t:CDS:2, partial [Ambispora gerdemannii]
KIKGNEFSGNLLMRAPEDIISTVNGPLIKVEHKIKVSISLSGAKDIEIEQPIIVSNVMPAELHQQLLRVQNLISSNAQTQLFYKKTLHVLRKKELTFDNRDSKIALEAIRIDGLSIHSGIETVISGPLIRESKIKVEVWLSGFKAIEIEQSVILSNVMPPELHHQLLYVENLTV